MAASLSGETTSVARQPNELVAHSRNGDSEPAKLFLPSLRGVRGVTIHALIELLGLRTFFPEKDASMPATAPG
jgi:hypothetical protein